MTPRPPFNVYAVISTLKTPSTSFQLASETNKIKPKRPLNPYFTRLFSHQTHSYGTARVQMTPQATLLCQCCQVLAISTLKTSWTDFLETIKIKPRKASGPLFNSVIPQKTLLQGVQFLPPFSRSLL